MPSLLFPDTGTRLVVLPSGRPAARATGYLYADAALSTPAEAYEDLGGVRGELLPTDEEGRRYITLDVHGEQPPYWGPDAGGDRLWIVFNGVASAVDADYNARIDAVEIQVADLGSSPIDAGDVSDAVAAEAALRAAGDTAAASAAAADATSKADAAQAFAVQRGNHTGVQPIGTVTGLQDALDGKADLVGGLIPSSQIPALSFNETHPVASQAAMLALSALTGDLAVRTDLTPNKVFILTASDPSVLANWTEVTAAGSVSSINGQSGAVTLAKGDIGLGNVDNTSDVDKPVSTATAAALTGKVSKDSLVVNVEDYAVGNANFLHTDGKWYTDSSHTVEATDDTAVIRGLVTAGAKHLTFGSRRYLVKWTQQTSFLSWANASGITIEGHGAVLCDTTVYTVSPANPYTPVFEFDACSNVSVSGVDYVGPAIASPATNHGYVGATFVRAENGSSNVKVDATITNARYGVQSGSYPTASDGYNKGFDLRLRCYFVAYPVAHYLADDVRADIYAVDVHRACYLAGVNGARVRIQFKNQWIANMVCLLTDSLTGTGTSRGCTDIDAEVTDLGSDRTELTSVLAGIALQRCDPNTTFANLRFRLYSKSTDTVSQNVTGFQIVSGVHSLYPDTYPFNWIPSIYLKNITVSGLIDKSQQTVSHATGNLYVQTNDGASAATVSNFRLDGLTILPSSGEASFDYLYLPGLIDRAIIRDCAMDNYSLTIIGNTTAPVIVDGSRLGNVVSATKTSYINSTVRTLSDGSWANSESLNSTFSGASCRIRQKQVELTLTGPSVSWTSAIPANVISLGMTGRITQTITGSTGMQVGVAGDLTRFVNTNNTAAGSQFTPANQAVTELYPRWSGGASTTVVVTSKTADFTGGKVKLFFSYIEFAAPTS